MEIEKKELKLAPNNWRASSVHTECSLHQLSPYIGKLKSKIAKDLILNYSRPGDVIFDPFMGSGTVPLEAVLNKRNVVASDISAYAQILTKAKLFPPSSLDEALIKAEELLESANALPPPDLRKIPFWVRQFFHPQTLKESLKFAQIGRKEGNEFFFACFLGILHHQRPGFLSYPSSHLVPYLRDKILPKEHFPELYEYKDIRSRLLKKIIRAYARWNEVCFHQKPVIFTGPIEKIKIQRKFNCLITSPPYMNALDYVRDNRLRLWFINPKRSLVDAREPTSNKEHFKRCIISLAKILECYLSPKGYGIFVVGEMVAKSPRTCISNLVSELVSCHAPSLRLREVIRDEIPDIRRSRRDCRGTKTEHVLIFGKR